MPTPNKRLRIVGFALLATGALIALWSVFSYGGATEPEIIPPRPVDAPGPYTIALPRCELNNGYQICRAPDGAEVLYLYKMSQGVLGKALTAYDLATRRQYFTNAVVWFDPAGLNADWQTQMVNLGEEDMKASGRVPRTDPPAPHPVVNAYLLELQDRGVDLLRVFGPMVSDPVCDKITSFCVQWSSKTKFLFPQDARATTQVSLAPLGQNRLPVSEPTVIHRPIAWHNNFRLIIGMLLAIGAELGGLVFWRIANYYDTIATNDDLASSPVIEAPPRPRRGRLK